MTTELIQLTNDAKPGVGVAKIKRETRAKARTRRTREDTRPLDEIYFEGSDRHGPEK